MAKVKKSALNASGRNAKASKKMDQKRRAVENEKGVKTRKAVRTRKAVTSQKAVMSRKPVKRGRAASSKTAVRRSTAAKKSTAVQVVTAVRVKALDPHQKCGPGTSVQSLYRVDETVDGRSTAHLVFNDRHGWYCEHGRTCPAVGHAKKYDGRIARAS